ncbi:hypothetical protein ACFQQB_55650 [Nonomuraea rubra]|uniref:hypothetical protein n=1 Tax=Nonomuraea rubra TaxID=46180 RepID=UPI0036172262
MPRLTDPDPASFPDDVREFLTTLPPDPMVRMLSHSAGTVKPFVQLAAAQFSSLELPARSRELVILTVAEYTESSFVTAQHVPMARAAGVDERTRALIGARRLDDPGLSPTTARCSASPPRWCSGRASPTSCCARCCGTSASASWSRCCRWPVTTGRSPGCPPCWTSR